jgi:hypothetical protein
MYDQIRQINERRKSSSRRFDPSQAANVESSEVDMRRRKCELHRINGTIDHRSKKSRHTSVRRKQTERFPFIRKAKHKLPPSDDVQKKSRYRFACGTLM